MKKCCTCKEIKELSEFHKVKTNIDGLKNYCKMCASISNKKQILKRDKRIHNNKARLWKKNNPDKVKNMRLKQSYNIDLNKYNEMVLKQNNRCAICHEYENELDNTSIKIKKLSIDHCHKTNKIRGLLCCSCNKGIGLLKDNIEILKQAIEYLEKNNMKTIEELTNEVKRIMLDDKLSKGDALERVLHNNRILDLSIAQKILDLI